MKRFLRYSFIVFLFILYIYTIVFSFLPISTKYILEILGFVSAIGFLFSKQYRLNQSVRWILLFAVVIFFWDLFVCFINGTQEFILTKSLITPIASIFGAQFLYICSKRCIVSHHDFLMVIVYTVFIESLICVMMKFSPAVYNLMDTIQVTLNGEVNIGDIATYHRFVGIGNAVYFSSLPSSAIGLLSIVYEIHYQKDKKRLIFLYIAFVFVSIVAFLVARTAIGLVAIALFLLLLYLGKEKISRSFLVLFCIVLLSYVVYRVLITHLDENTLKWAFTFLMSKDEISNQDDSAYYLYDWITNTHFSFKTLLVGDGLYAKDGIYYMQTDIGFFRRIFYGGLLGLYLMLYYHARIAYYTYKCVPTKDFKFIMYALFACYMVILAKGDAIMLSHFILFLVFFEKGIFHKIPANK